MSDGIMTTTVTMAIRKTTGGSVCSPNYSRQTSIRSSSPSSLYCHSVIENWALSLLFSYFVPFGPIAHVSDPVEVKFFKNCMRGEGREHTRTSRVGASEREEPCFSPSTKNPNDRSENVLLWCYCIYVHLSTLPQLESTPLGVCGLASSSFS